MTSQTLHQLAGVLHQAQIGVNFENSSTLVVYSMYNSVHVLSTLRMFPELDYLATKEAANDLKIRVSLPKEKGKSYRIITSLPSSKLYPCIDFDNPSDWQSIINGLY